MKIAVSQLNSRDEVAVNLETVISHLQQAAAQDAKIVFFPENTLFFRITHEAQVQALNLDSPEIEQICAECKRLNTAAHLTTALRIDSKVYNASILIESSGKKSVTYLKMHLFDIALKDQKPVRESDVFDRGERPSVFEFEKFIFGNSICYDIRFSELYNFYARQSVDVILVPAAFLVKTGRAHWETLLRARAIESQCYVVAPAQAGRHLSATNPELFRETYGHAMIINPWGEVVARLEQGVGLLYYTLSRDEINTVREQIPMSSHRRDFFK